MKQFFKDILLASSITLLSSTLSFSQNEQMAIDGSIKIGNTETETPMPGTIRYNTNTSDFEGWNGSHWLSLTKGYRLGSVEDIDGNKYRTVIIGSQEWMAENLNTTKYQNGDEIPNTSSASGWSNLSSGSYSFYQNNATLHEAPYGKLYNRYAIMDNRGLCPTGWRVPTSVEWVAMINTLGELPAALGKLKEEGLTYWNAPNLAASNTTGFSGRPGGYRTDTGSFSGVGVWGIFGFANATYGSLNNENNDILLFSNEKFGFSVRCVKE